MNNLNMLPTGRQTEGSHTNREYPWQIKPIAFQIAAGFLVVNTLLSLTAYLLGQIPNIISLVIDVVLAISLFNLHSSARGFTLFRAYAGAVVMPILAFTQYGVATALIITIIQLAYSGSLVLLLQSGTKNWKIYTAVGIFIVFVIGITGILLILAFIGRMLN